MKTHWSLLDSEDCFTPCSLAVSLHVQSYCTCNLTAHANTLKENSMTFSDLSFLCGSIPPTAWFKGVSNVALFLARIFFSSSGQEVREKDPIKSFCYFLTLPVTVRPKFSVLVTIHLTNVPTNVIFCHLPVYSTRFTWTNCYTNVFSVLINLKSDNLSHSHISLTRTILCNQIFHLPQFRDGQIVKQTSFCP